MLAEIPPEINAGWFEDVVLWVGFTWYHLLIYGVAALLAGVLGDCFIGRGWCKVPGYFLFLSVMAFTGVYLLSAHSIYRSAIRLQLLIPVKVKSYSAVGPMDDGMRPHGSPQQLEDRRLRAFSLIQEGRGTTEVARLLHVDPRSVRRWMAAGRRRGPRALAARPASGRPPKLNARQRAMLKRRLLKGARASGFPTELWTCPRLVKVIEREFGVTYHVDHLPRLLHGLGFSCQKPARRARERDEEAIRRWVAVDWPRLKKKRRGSARPSSSSTKPD